MSALAVISLTSRSRPKKKLASCSPNGSSPWYGESRAKGPVQISRPSRKSSIVIAYSSTPRFCQIRRPSADAPRSIAQERTSRRASLVALHPVQHDSQVPILEAVAEEEEVAVPEVLGDHTG